MSPPGPGGVQRFKRSELQSCGAPLAAPGIAVVASAIAPPPTYQAMLNDS